MRTVVAAWHPNPGSDTEERWRFKRQQRVAQCDWQKRAKEQREGKEWWGNNNSRCRLICCCFFSKASYTLSPCTNLQQAGSRVVMASFCCTLACCHRRTVQASGCNSALSYQKIAIQCVKKLLCGPFHFSSSFLVLLCAFSSSSSTLNPENLKEKPLFNFTEINTSTTAPALSFWKQYEWVPPHVVYTVHTNTYLMLIMSIMSLALQKFPFLSPSSLLTPGCLVTHPVLLMCLWCDDVMMWCRISLTAVFGWCHVLSSMLHYIWLWSGPLGLTVSHITCNVNLAARISICRYHKRLVLHLWFTDNPHLDLFL